MLAAVRVGGGGMISAPPTEITASRQSVSRPRGYIEHYRPQQRTIVLINDAIKVLNEYHDHWPLTVRQIYYRLVGAYGYPKTEAFYEKLTTHVSNARRGRVIPFEAIRDDGVSVVEITHFNDHEQFQAYVRTLGEHYQRNRLANQEHHIEVWCEAGGMVYQLANVAEPYSIEVRSSGGFDSTTARYDLAQRICQIGKPAVILHLGDADPSGDSLFEAAAEDVAAFVEADRPWGTVNVRFVRVALTLRQMRLYNLPTERAKDTDSRTKNWIARRGSDQTCQLEALPPDAIADILRREIEYWIDDDQYRADLEAEAWERQQITHALPAPQEGGA